jgi:DNA-binding transcriptional MerR regulator
MKKKPKSAATGMTAAECARRIGLTVRALRVYERAGLLKPLRSAKGWRVYGPADVERLNIVTALKDFGVTLAQIRKAFGAAPPALAAVLDMQLKTWAARRIAADRAIALIQAATVRLHTRANLTIEELCELTRSTEMTNIQAVMREMINQHITPEQEREWLTYWAQRGPGESLVSEEARAMFRRVAQEYLELMKSGAAPDSDAVQAVTERSTRAWLDSDMRQRQLEQLEWNPEVTRAWAALGGKLLARSVVPEDPAEADRLMDFIQAARAASRTVKVLMPVVQEAFRLSAAGVKPGAPEARKLAAKYAEICQAEGFGEPRMAARWIVEFTPLPEAGKIGWKYLAQI